ncbi:hypothetical protein BT96DRAFT_914555 [Gymnopus androsaceus JB14]|uniref:Uncharacterized protein n=1 Tax=Gymnopus androsaceus JB14 TaxID=1447944 RepID=A0A6A4IEP3_9AGAR|nr:hypothetical protein BT96DRAFT_914555 [Gymnopus androsaceus JB14]
MFEKLEELKIEIVEGFPDQVSRVSFLLSISKICLTVVCRPGSMAWPSDILLV